MEKENKRITKTKQALRDCLFQMLETQGLEEISVKDLCENANVNRSTFYNHYEDIEDFIEEIETYIANYAIEVLSSRRYGSNYEEQATDAFCDLLFNEQDIAKWILDDRTTGTGRRLIAEHAKSKFFSIWKRQGVNDLECEYYFTFAFEGCMGFLKKWYDNGFKDNTLDVKKMFYDIVRKTINFIHY